MKILDPLRQSGPAGLLLVLLNVPPLASGQPVATIEVIRSRFCLGQPSGLSYRRFSPNTITLRLETAISYENKRHTPIILALPETPTVIVSRTPESLLNGSDQLRTPPPFKRTAGDLRERGFDLSRPPSRYFSIVEPGRRVSPMAPEDITVVVSSTPTEGPQTNLLGRKIFLQLDLDHSAIPSRLANDLRHSLAFRRCPLDGDRTKSTAGNYDSRFSRNIDL